MAVVARKIRRMTMTRKQRLAELRAFVRICFTAINEPDLKEVSNHTLLSVSTLKRIQTRKLSLNVRFGTIQALGLAAGLKLEWTETGCKMNLVD